MPIKLFTNSYSALRSSLEDGGPVPDGLLFALGGPVLELQTTSHGGGEALRRVWGDGTDNGDA